MKQDPICEASGLFSTQSAAMGCSPSVPQTTAKAVALPPVTKRPAYYDDDWAKLPKDAPDGQRIQSAMSGLTLVGNPFKRVAVQHFEI